MKKILLVVLAASILSCFAGIKQASARHEGFYFGGGYQQPIMYTWTKQGSAAPNPGSSMKFFPNFGAFLIAGYDFTSVDKLGLAIVPNWGMLKLNKAEWVQLINADAEVLYHFFSSTSDTKFDPYIAGIVGFNFMTEGKIKNQSQSLGPDFGVSFGLNYTLSEYARAGSPRVTNLSLYAEVPVKWMMFINDYDLSNKKTLSVLQFPVRVGITYSF